MVAKQAGPDALLSGAIKLALAALNFKRRHCSFSPEVLFILRCLLREYLRPPSQLATQKTVSVLQENSES